MGDEYISVLTIGVFDCLHEGHLNIFYKLHKIGRLEVGVIKDEAVRKQKGQNRPIMNENFRLKLISALRCVNHAYLIPNFEFTDEMIKAYDIIAVGEDQNHIKGIHNIPKAKLIILPRTEGVSTSEIIKRMS